jgi:hypothetical protein
MDVQRTVDAAASQLGLKIATEHRPGVERYYTLAAQMAALLEGLPLTPADEPGTVFRPVAPERDE